MLWSWWYDACLRHAAMAPSTHVAPNGTSTQASDHQTSSRHCLSAPETRSSLVPHSYLNPHAFFNILYPVGLRAATCAMVLRAVVFSRTNKPTNHRLFLRSSQSNTFQYYALQRSSGILSPPILKRLHGRCTQQPFRNATQCG